MNNDVFVAKGYEHIWVSSGHRLKCAFCGCLIDVEACAYVRSASYARLEQLPNGISYANMMLAQELRLSANNDASNDNFDRARKFWLG